jgi:uncharacterized protein (DUF302 family)
MTSVNTASPSTLGSPSAAEQPGPGSVPALTATVGLPLADAEAAVRAALTDQGFGVLTEIDVAGVLAAKLGVTHRPTKILGACRPALAHRALTADPSMALLLPCNVVLREEEPGHTEVAIVDPVALLAGAGAPEELSAVAAEAAQRLGAVRDALAQRTGPTTPA